MRAQLLNHPENQFVGPNFTPEGLGLKCFDEIHILILPKFHETAGAFVSVKVAIQDLTRLVVASQLAAGALFQ